MTVNAPFRDLSNIILHFSQKVEIEMQAKIDFFYIMPYNEAEKQ